MPSRDAVRAEPQVGSDARNEAYGRLIEQRRKEVGLNQVELAGLAHVHRGTIRNAEQGRPMDVRTHPDILRALGCAPNLKNWDNHESPTLDQVFSARVSCFVAKVLLDSDSQIAPEDYFELISELANRRLLPGQRELCDHIASMMRPIDAELFDAEVATILEGTSLYPVVWVNGRRLNEGRPPLTAFPLEHPAPNQSGEIAALLTEGMNQAKSALASAVFDGFQHGVPQSVVTAILKADISDAERQRLIAHAAQRSAEMTSSLVSEIAVLIDVIVKR